MGEILQLKYPNSTKSDCLLFFPRLKPMYFFYIKVFMLMNRIYEILVNSFEQVIRNLSLDQTFVSIHSVVLYLPLIPGLLN